MNEISRVQLGLTGPNTNAPKAEAKAEEKAPEVVAQPKVPENKSEDILNSLNLAGQYNVARLGFQQVDPNKYLTPERIADIEASMGVFDQGVASHLGALQKEFGHLGEFDSLSEADKLEMAAKSFAHSA